MNGGHQQLREFFHSNFLLPDILHLHLGITFAKFARTTVSSRCASAQWLSRYCMRQDVGKHNIVVVHRTPLLSPKDGANQSLVCHWSVS